MRRWGRYILLLCLATVVFVWARPAIAQDSDRRAELNKQIEEYQRQRTLLQGQANTLANQIKQFDLQIKLTQLGIDETEERIKLLGGRIDQLEGSLESLTKAFSTRAVETYKMARVGEPFLFLASSKDLNEAVVKQSYLKKIQESDRDLLVRLQVAQNTYKTQKTESEKLQEELTIQRKELDNQKKAKAQLLAVTKNDEKRYQQLIIQAQAELASLSQYAQSVGISLLPHQELSDGWGKYFNQRDSQWGNLLANNDTSNCRGGPCTLARIGCLITSYAMVVSHYGGSFLPSDVATNPSNFSGTADFANPGPSANGHSVTRLDNPSIDDLKSRLNSGAVVIAGLSMNGGPYPQHYSDHWVVLRSVDGDNFKINDPVYPGAMNVSFKDHYSGWTIIQARVYN